MFQDSILEVAVALAFLFALLSLVVTSVTEGLANVFSLRAWMLERWLSAMLEQRYGRAKRKAAALGQTITDRLLAHPLVRSLCPPGHRLPDFIPSEVFASVLLEVLVDGEPAKRPESHRELRERLATLPESSPLRAVLSSLDVRVEGDLRRLEAAIGRWFDDSMNRLSGWYGRRAQLIAFGFASVLTIALNVDTVMIADALWEDEDLREAVVREAVAEQARQIASEPSPTQEPALVDEAPGSSDAEPAELDPRLLEPLRRLDAFPIGWASDANDRRAPPGTALGWLTKLLGFAITVLAITLGAPFWFDLISRVMGMQTAHATRRKVAVAAAAAATVTSGNLGREVEVEAETEREG